MKPFRNEPYNDFNNPKIRRKMEKAVAQVEYEFGKEYDLVIGGKRVKCEKKLYSYNPAKKDEVIGIFQKADEQIAEKTRQAALKAFETWRYTPATVRANYLFKIANIMRRRRFELNSWMVLETSKNWLEADADTAEAIDFCDYYGHEVLRYDRGPKLLQLKDERDEQRYIPLGVGIVIPPWNFPLAILTGMTWTSFAV